MCGEQEKEKDNTKTFIGSPPRVRGAVLRQRMAMLDARITPACAGSRSPPTMAATSATDHPRVCGEQLRTFLNILYASGSPPRVRGAGVHQPIAAAMYRITPACAGSSPASWFLLFLTEDHPRVCGEQAGSRKPGIAPGGSPPRVRGAGNR